MELTVSILWEITTVAAHLDLLEMGDRMVMVALVRKCKSSDYNNIIIHYHADIDECVVDRDIGISCIIGATCINTNGSFACQCPAGHTGDGRWFRSGCNG